MPDIQTALNTALSKMSSKEMTHVNNLLDQWAEAERTTMTTSPSANSTSPAPTNISRGTFNFIKDNPGFTVVEATKRLHSLGFKKSSTTSLISQLVRNGQLRRDGDKLYAVGNEYRPLPQTRKKLQRIKRTIPVKSEAPKEPTAPTLLVRRPMPSFDAQEMVNRWSAYQAREVYQELKTIFGG